MPKQRNEPRSLPWNELATLYDTCESLASEGRWEEAWTLWLDSCPMPRWELRTYAGQPYDKCIGASIPGLPPALDWQRDLAVPPPPGYVRARCLCQKTVVRAKHWSAGTRDGVAAPNYDGDRRARMAGPSVTVGSECDRCGAPLIVGWGEYVIRLDPPVWPDPRERRRTTRLAQHVLRTVGLVTREFPDAITTVPTGDRL